MESPIEAMNRAERVIREKNAEIERLRAWLQHIAKFSDGQHAADWATDALNGTTFPDQ